MTDPDACLSVIIPTHNRRQLLGKVLAALSRQTVDPATFEVVVVCDGCTDGTRDMLCDGAFPFALKLVEQHECSGPAMARNAGANVAIGALLLFLDDDVEPVPGCIEAHQRAHELAREATVVLGPYPPVPHASGNLFRLIVRAWWRRHFEKVADEGHRFSFCDLLTGNLSLPAHIWQQLGGLDPNFRAAREDYELGVRLMQRGLPFRFAADAMAYHHEHATMTLDGSFRRAREEGRSDVLLGEKHPHVRSALRITVRMRESSHLLGWIDRVTFTFGAGADPLLRAIGSMLPLFGRLRLRFAYLALYRWLNAYWYLRGAAEVLGSWSAWRDFAMSASLPRATKRLNIDVRGDMQSAEEAIDVAAPDEVALSYRGYEFGTLECEAGAEPWRGRHLRYRLCGSLAPAYLKCLLEADDLGEVLTYRSVTTRRLLEGLPLIQSPRRAEMWWEVTRQWQAFVSDAAD
ncbi:glycosyltransferase family 2 protein [Bradyrhizobium liaoningense]|uniref:glycosyltransferase family 2 protein n=1 Tax=Bradyrhizobium liaoningense TaxID=43992 RepID=UPI001BAD55F9|nr:glycosyltransferase family 2 protein [Bradyrhizobium liaoningense]MBR1170974.1 glycosyltransferase family 2 protein [Bradyrhizobium liaoningense]